MKGIAAVCIITGLLAAGCASTPQQPAGQFRHLDGSNPAAAVAADLPVESAAEAVAHGDDELAKGKLDHAVYYYVRSLDFDSKNAETFYKIGIIHLSKGDVQRAEWAFRLTLERKPDHARAQEGLGLILLRRRDHAGAQAQLEGALKSDPNLWAAENGLAALADLRGDSDAALQHYEAAVRLNPESAQVQNNFGYSRYLAGDWSAAEGHYRRAIQLDPKFRQAWQNLGQLKVRRGDLEDAVETFSQILTRAEAENNVGYLCMVSRDYGTAERYFRRAIKDSPSYYGRAEHNLVQLQRLQAGGKEGTGQL